MKSFFSGIKGQDIVNHEYRMCLYSKPAHILNYQITIFEGKCDYRILDDGLVQVFRKDVCLTEEEIRSLLMAYAGMLEECREYLLDFANVSLQDDGFFWRRNGSVGFMYMPIKRDPGFQRDYRDKIENWLANVHQHVFMEDEAVMNMLHPLSVAISDEDFDLMKLEGLIKRMVMMK